MAWILVIYSLINLILEARLYRPWTESADSNSAETLLGCNVERASFCPGRPPKKKGLWPISPPPVQVASITRHREEATEQMKMNPWTLSVLLLLAGPLGADPDWHVEYPESFCVVEGSTATIPCSFTHPKVHKGTGAVVERVVWCPNHPICHLTTPNVYDSSKVRADSRFLYLGDLVGNCTLKIIKTVKQDAARYRFRFVTNGDKYTGQRGVRVNVTDGEDVKVRSSVTDHVVKEGGQVTLTCTSACSFHQLDVHWYRNGDALSEIGPALHLSNLTNDDTGSYTCSLHSSWQKTSAPWRLVVMEKKSGWRVAVSVVSVLLAVFLLLLAGLVFAKRRQAQKKASDVIQKLEVDCKQEAVGASEEVSYSTVHFKRNSSRSAPGPEHEIVYSEVVR